MPTQTKTKTKPKPRRKPAATKRPANGRQPKPAKKAAAPKAFEPIASVAIDQIAPSPWQPRKEFAAEKLAELAASIKALGLIEPVIIRKRPGYDGKLRREHYEVVAGERRLRAAKLAGLAEVPARVVDVDHATARAMTFDENRRREDLDPIEMGRMLKAMLDDDDAASQAELGKRIGWSQSRISNHLRMLELPADWQKRIQAGEIPPTHVRHLLPYRQHPALLKAIGRQIGKGRYERSVEEFGYAVDRAVYSVTRPITGKMYDHKVHEEVPAYRPKNDAERDQLQLVDVSWRGTKPEPRATNVKAYDRLYTEHRKQYVAKQKTKGQKGAKSGSTSKTRKPTLSPAALRDQERERAVQWARKLGRVKADWLRYLIAQELLVFDAEAERGRAEVVVVFASSLIRLLVFLASDPSCWRTQSDLVSRSDLVDKLVKSAGRKIKCSTIHGFRQADNWDAAHEVSIEEAARFVAGQFWHADLKRANHSVPHPHVASIAAYLGVDPEAAWRREQLNPLGPLGPLSQAYFGAHTKDQLVALGEELKVYIPPGKPKSWAVNHFLKACPGTPFPKELKRAKLAD